MFYILFEWLQNETWVVTMSPVVNETKLMQIIKIIEINKVKNDFYRYLRSELELRNSDLVFIAVDKL